MVETYLLCSDAKPGCAEPMVHVPHRSLEASGGWTHHWTTARGTCTYNE